MLISLSLLFFKTDDWCLYINTYMVGGTLLEKVSK